MSPVSVWDELTPEQYAVMTNAIEEAYLNCVIYDHNLYANGRRVGGGSRHRSLNRLCDR